MNLLIDKTDIARFKNISNHTTLERVNEYINDAQFQDLRPLLGDDFYFDILKNKALPDYQKLINGDTWDLNGCEWSHQGLRIVLSEFTWGRYTYFGSYNDTPNGNTLKTFEFSQPTPNADRKDVWKESKQRANSYFDIIKIYLDNSNFDKWNNACNDGCGNKRNTNFNYDRII